MCAMHTVNDYDDEADDHDDADDDDYAVYPLISPWHRLSL